MADSHSGAEVVPALEILEQPGDGGRTLAGVYSRVAARLLALAAAIRHN